MLTGVHYYRGVRRERVHGVEMSMDGETTQHQMFQRVHTQCGISTLSVVCDCTHSHAWTSSSCPTDPCSPTGACCIFCHGLLPQYT